MSAEPRQEISATRLTVIAILVVFSAMAFWDWNLPGLYMDSVNPEYIVSSILHPHAAGNRFWVLPGNAIHDRFPVFTGTLYHGSTQLYFALPFMLAFGETVFTMRLVQAMVGCIILLGCFRLAGADGSPRRVVLVGIVGLLAIDPAFVLPLRTQAYSCLFPLILLLPAIGLLHGRRWQRASSWPVLASGALFGSAVFGYFIFAFFFPVMILLVLRRSLPFGARAMMRAGLLWAVGALLGYFPFVCGIALISNALGGIGPTLAWLKHHGDQMQIVNPHVGWPARAAAVGSDYWSVLNGDWPFLAMLKRHAEGPWGDIKAALMLAVPALALIRVRRDAERCFHIALPLLFTVSFLAFASYFGERLDGHHYTVLLPLLYVSFASACVALIDRSGSDGRTPGWIATAASVLVSCVAVLVSNVDAQKSAHAQLQVTGGVGLYSDSINRFALDVAAREPDATAYFADWGFEMPFVYLTRGMLDHRDTVDPSRIREQSCGGTPQIVVFAGDDNAARNAYVAGLAGLPPPVLVDWRQRDGETVFQSARFAAQSCAARAAGDSGVTPVAPFIETDAGTVSGCAFITPSTVSVRWDTGKPESDPASVWIQAPGSEPKLWSGGKARGDGRTGAWVTPGMNFVLKNSAHEAVAHAVVAGAPCPFH